MSQRLVKIVLKLYLIIWQKRELLRERQKQGYEKKKTIKERVSHEEKKNDVSCHNSS